MSEIERTPTVKINREVWKRAEEARIKAMESKNKVLRLAALSKEGWYSYLIDSMLGQLGASE